MSNTNNNFPNSQAFPEQEKFRFTLHNCNEEELVALEYIGEQKGRGVSIKELCQVLRKSQSVTNSIVHRLRSPEEYIDRLNTHLLVAVRGKRGANFYVLRQGVFLEDIKATMAKNGYNRMTYQMALGLEQPENQQQQQENQHPINSVGKKEDTSATKSASNYSESDEDTFEKEGQLPEKGTARNETVEATHPDLSKLLSVLEQLTSAVAQNNAIVTKLAEDQKKSA